MPPISTPAPRCAATNRRGAPCGMPPAGGGPYCFAHDPTRGAQRATARRTGGRQRQATRPDPDAPREGVALASVADVRALLERTVADTLTLGNSPQRSRTLGTLIGVALRTLEVGELEARLAALEQRLTEPPHLRRIA